MRNAFAEEITKIAEVDERVVFLSGDIGNRLFDDYKKKFPNRFFNCGVAEANMASMSAGIAMCGLRPVTYTITAFNTTRCLEQIRIDICYHNVPVVVVGVGAGLSYASLGCTHHTCEDISFLRSIPNMTVVCPGDAMELRKLIWEAFKINGPVYIRIGKKGEPKVYSEIPDVKIGKAHIVQKGSDICLLATGNMLPVAVDTAKLLASHQISAQVVSLHTVKPLDGAALQSFTKTFPILASIEEHSLIGGLGSSLAEWFADNHIFSTKLLRFGTRDEFPHKLGTQDYIRNYFGLNADTIANSILSSLQKKEEKYAYTSRHSS